MYEITKCTIISENFEEEIEFNSSNVFEEEENQEEETMAANQTLKQLSQPNLDNQPLGIVFPTLGRPVKLNSSFLNLLPKFYGRAGEDPHRHLKEFLVVCSTMRPEGVDDKQV